MTIPDPPVPLPVEHRTRLLLNGAELLTIQTTPVDLTDWAAGFLHTEGFIDALSDLLRLEVAPDGATVHAEVAPGRLPAEDLAGKRYLTSGCGKGVTFSSVKDAMMLRPVTHDLAVSRDRLLTAIKRMQAGAPLYARSGGMHAAAALHLPTDSLVVREDIGRHNAVDKAIGAALKAGWSPAEVVILTTGRISYEMCSKLARYGAGVGASLTAATDQAIRLANKLGLDLVGYVRTPAKLTVYTEGRRVV